MSLSTIIGLVWVLAVSAAHRGWAIQHLAAIVFWLGVAYVVVRLLEVFGILTANIPVKPLKFRRRRSADQPAA